MRAASYIRVSTAQQATEDKVSLEEQQVNIETYCGSEGYRIVERYRDVGSGASERRPDFQRMLKDTQEGRFDVIVAWKSDRLSRGLYPAAALMEALEGSQIGVEAVRDSVDVNTFSLLAAVGKIELENIRERARMGSRDRGIERRGESSGACSSSDITWANRANHLLPRLRPRSLAGSSPSTSRATTR